MYVYKKNVSSETRDLIYLSCSDRLLLNPIVGGNSQDSVTPSYSEINNHTWSSFVVVL